MAPPHVSLHFDFVDPLSYLMEIELGALDPGRYAPIQRIPFELRPPPEPPTDPEDPFWAPRWKAAEPIARALGVLLVPPSLVPWSRKAHEFHAHAAELGAELSAREVIFRAFFTEGRDIGRVDVLVDLGVALGLDRSALKAALDVDRHRESVAGQHAAARVGGIRDTPTLLVGTHRVEGFHNRDALRTLLPRI